MESYSEAKAKAKWYQLDQVGDLILERYSWNGNLRFKKNNKIILECAYNLILMLDDGHFAVTEYYNGIFPFDKILKWNKA